MHLWDWFFSIRKGLGVDQKISYSELKAWSELTGNELNPKEVEVIKTMDLAFIGAVHG